MRPGWKKPPAGAFIHQKNLDVFERQKVFSAQEVHSRYEIKLENYVKVIDIEALSMLDIARRMILPAAIAYSGAVAQEAAQKKQVCPDLPMETETRIRLRIDGMLLPYLETDRGLHPALVARIKILSNLDIAEKRSPQDGHFKTRVDGVEINLRTSVVPSMFGEKVVLRYLNSSAPVVNARQFGMNEKNYQKFQRMLQNPNGIIYLTGPTGSAKTTTL